MLQHSLPLQHDCFGGVAAVAVLIKAKRLSINKRYFITLCFDSSLKTSAAKSLRAPNRCLGERTARRWDGRTLETGNNPSVREKAKTGTFHCRDEIVGDI
jgi:hypothetical protein